MIVDDFGSNSWLLMTLCCPIYIYIYYISLIFSTIISTAQLKFLNCSKSLENLFFVSFVKSRHGLKKSNRKILKHFGRKNILKVSLFFSIFFQNSLRVFLWKFVDPNIFHKKTLKEFWKFSNFYWRNFQNILSTKIFQYFSMRFFKTMSTLHERHEKQVFEWFGAI